jgi:hypothetical protein
MRTPYPDRKSLLFWQLFIIMQAWKWLNNILRVAFFLLSFVLCSARLHHVRCHVGLTKIAYLDIYVSLDLSIEIARPFALYFTSKII